MTERSYGFQSLSAARLSNRQTRSAKRHVLAYVVGLVDDHAAGGGRAYPSISILLQNADAALSSRDFAAFGHFVICFSEVEDDLGQWRGYGGGQCGYAIGFDYSKLYSALPNIRADALLTPMNYDPVRQTFIVDDLLKNAEKFFMAGLSGKDAQRWASEFLEAFSLELDIFACITKHPAFAAEHERRIILRLNPNETNRLEFRQKQTLLARHLPIDLRGSDGLLPITRICVGPGPAQRFPSKRRQPSHQGRVLEHSSDIECCPIPYSLTSQRLTDLCANT